MTSPNNNKHRTKKNFTIYSFIHDSRSVGILLLVCTAASLILSNIGSTQDGYCNLWNIELPGFHHFHLPHSVLHFINDALMALFFFQVGLEIKRESTIGELSSPSRMMLPTVAAASGVVVPALIYLLITKGTIYQNGWAIPAATDIAFSLGILSLLGKSIPHAFRVFLAALAIIDDLCAIIIIAFFYGEQPQFEWLIAAVVCSVVIFFVLKKTKSHASVVLGILLGIVLWYLIHRSGIHATFSGVIMAMLMPINKVKALEKVLTIPVNFIIVPLFALANTSIVINSGSLENMGSALSWGIILGLCLGKPLGISLAVFGMEKLKIVRLDMKRHWGQFIGVAILAGIGFTMSIFVSVLAFSNDSALLDTAKLSVLIASTISMIVGYVWLRIASRPVAD